MAPYFPEEIITDIMKRLPVKSLLHFRCVKKSWYSLIHSSQFIALHSDHQKTQSNKNKYLLFYYNSSKTLSIYYDDENFGEYSSPKLPSTLAQPIFHATVNGLICLSSQIENRPKQYYFEREIHIWNPAIRKLFTLPPRCNVNHELYMNIKMKLGIGFLPKSNDYKVVKIMFGYYRSVENSIMGVNVYSLSSNSWKTINVDGLLDIDFSFGLVIVNGAAFLKGLDVKNNISLIVCFDMENDVACKISLPEETCPRYVDLFLQVYDESLALFQKDHDLKLYNMWVMKEGFSWNKKISVSVEGNIKRRILSKRNNGLDFVMQLNRCDFAFYNVDKKETRKIVESSKIWKHYRKQRVKVNPFTESLVGLNTLFDYKQSTKSLT